MKVEVLHELNVVHEHFLADVALEGHVRLELRGQHLLLSLQQFKVGWLKKSQAIEL